MNPWINKSIELANSSGYLDRLHEVYPVSTNVERPLSEREKGRLKDLYDRRDGRTLIDMLIRRRPFPIKDPYVAFLRKNRYKFVPMNPETVNRLADAIFALDFDEVVEGLEKPIEFNRQIGTLFKKWLLSLSFPILPVDRFERNEGIALLDGGDAHLKEYANSILGCNLAKGPDVLVKCGRKFIVGEAKFLTDDGGHQNAQFEDALTLLRGTRGNALRIAILDGVVWIKSKKKMFLTVIALNESVLSALLFKEYLEDTYRNST